MFWVKENWLVLLMIFTNCYMSLKKWKKFLCPRTQTQQKPQKVSLAWLCCDCHLMTFRQWENIFSFFKARPYIVGVCGLQLVKGYTVVQDGFDA